MSENECRLFLLLVRDLIAKRTQALQSLRSFRRWCRWQGQLEFMDLIKVLERLSPEELNTVYRALSIGQVESKLWLLSVLKGLLDPERAYRFHIVGGWVGLLSLMLKWFQPETVKRIVQIDIDPPVNEIAKALNRDWVLKQKLFVQETNALDFNYDRESEIVINASCEHFTPDQLNFWIERIPAGRIVILQSNNLFSDPDHVNCYKNVFRFRQSVQLRTLLFSGEFEFQNYTRFMVIGITQGSKAAVL